MSNSLVGWWPLHEQSGQANDVSGNGNDGTVNGATQGVWGRGGLTAYSFDGSGDYIDVAGGIWDGTDPYTISLWYYPQDDSNTVVAYSETDGAGDVNFNINWSNGDLISAFVTDGTNSSSVSSSALSINNWYHVVLVINNGSAYLYKNGEFVDSSSWVFPSPTISNIGVVENGTGNFIQYFDGNIADVRLYDRALSPQEVQTLYEWGSGDYTDQTLHDGTDSGAVSRYEFNGDVTDSWGSNDGTDNTSAGFVSDGIRGSAKGFDGSDDDVTSTTTTFTEPFTVSFWMNPDSQSTFGGLVGADTIDPFRDEYVVRRDGDGNYEISIDNDGSGGNTIIPASKIDEGADEWYHIVATYNGSVAEIFLNSVSEDTLSFSSNVSVNSTRLGAYSTDTGTFYWSGDMDDVRIYDRALSQSEVHQLYRWGAQGRDLRQRLVKE